MKLSLFLTSSFTRVAPFLPYFLADSLDSSLHHFSDDEPAAHPTLTPTYTPHLSRSHAARRAQTSSGKIKMAHARSLISGMLVCYIPSASAFRTSTGKRITTAYLERMGLIVRELDVVRADRATVDHEISHADLIFIDGGNTFFLLQELRRSGADHAIKKAVRAGVPYVGVSAGAVIAGPTITPIGLMDDERKAGGLEDHRGLNLVDFMVVPHLSLSPLRSAAARIQRRYVGDVKLAGISDRAAIVVMAGRARILHARRSVQARLAARAWLSPRN